MRAGEIDLPEPGQAAFKIGGEAEGVGGKITGWDEEPVFGNEFVIASVGEQIIFDYQTGFDFGPSDMEPQVKKFTKSKRMGKTPPVITGVENNKTSINRRNKIANTARTNPPGDTDDIIHISPEGNPLLPAPVRFQRRATFGQTKRS